MVIIWLGAVGPGSPKVFQCLRPRIIDYSRRPAHSSVARGALVPRPSDPSARSWLPARAEQIDGRGAR